MKTHILHHYKGWRLNQVFGAPTNALRPPDGTASASDFAPRIMAKYTSQSNWYAAPNPGYVDNHSSAWRWQFDINNGSNAYPNTIYYQQRGLLLYRNGSNNRIYHRNWDTFNQWKEIKVFVKNPRQLTRILKPLHAPTIEQTINSTTEYPKFQRRNWYAASLINGDDYIRLPYNSLLDTEQFTCMMWVKLSSAQTGLRLLLSNYGRKTDGNYETPIVGWRLWFNNGENWK